MVRVGVSLVRSGVVVGRDVVGFDVSGILLSLHGRSEQPQQRMDQAAPFLA